MQSSIFDLDNRCMQLNKLRDPLVELNRVIDRDLLRATLSELAEKPRKSAAGRKQIDRVGMSAASTRKGRATTR